MRIRSKLVSIQMVMILGLIISLTVFSFMISGVMELKNLVAEINEVNRDIRNITSFSEILLTERTSAEEMYQTLKTQDDSIKTSLNKLITDRNIKKLDMGKEMSAFSSTWRTLTNSTMPALKVNLKEIAQSPINNLVIYRGIRQTTQSLKNITRNNQTNALFVKILDATHQNRRELSTSLTRINKEWVKVKEKLHVKAQESIKVRVRNSFIALGVIILIIFIIPFMVIRRITQNLNTVNQSIKDVASGEFTNAMKIPSGDEFGDLSRHFNLFMDLLWKKIDSMKDIMQDIGRAMNEKLDLNKVEQSMLSIATKNTGASAGAILILNENNEMVVSSSKGFFPPFYPCPEYLHNDRPGTTRFFEENIIPMDNALMSVCMTTQTAIMVRDCRGSDEFSQNQDPQSALYISSLMAVPLVNSGVATGVMIVIKTNYNSHFSDLDFTNLKSFGEYASMTIDSLKKYHELLEKYEMQKEIGIAAEIQTSLIPKRLPDIRGIKSAAYTLAAKGVSGDYYDLFSMDRHTIGATVCDVAGKGVPASLVMVMIRTVLRLISSPKRGAAETLTMLNKSISGKIDIDRYATMGFFKIDLRSRKLSFSNAAHHPLQIYRQSTGKFYAIDTPGLPIGIDRDSVFSEKRFSIHPGDIIFLYTDGFTEARNPAGEEYTAANLLKIIKFNCRKSAEAILNAVIEDMHKFTSRAKQHDDQTILVIKIDEEKQR